MNGACPSSAAPKGSGGVKYEIAIRVEWSHMVDGGHRRELLYALGFRGRTFIRSHIKVDVQFTPHMLLLLNLLRTLDARMPPTDEAIHINNGRWLHRLKLVKSLVVWVQTRLKILAPNYEGMPVQEETRMTEEKRHIKAEQYVVEHLALGKMHYPSTSEDPLFTHEAYTDVSLESQLMAPYSEFQAEVQRCLHEVTTYSGTAIATSWDTATNGMNHTTKEKLTAWWLEYTKQDPINQNDPLLVGLVLRYQCMGGFTSTIHGSVPASWGSTLMPTFIECFASPLNHKFSSYHSLFDDDAQLDSNCRGNFFRTVEQNDGRLPAGHSYELNPPFANAIYERLQAILERTLLVREDETTVDPGGMQLLLIAPAWNDASWMTGINNLRNNPNLHAGYKTYSRFVSIPKRDMQYTQDMSGLNFSCNTVAWFFSPVYSDLIDRLIPKRNR